MPLRPVDPSLLVRGPDEDPRLGRRVVAPGESAMVAILGGADDTGVLNSGGRVGAALGPTEIRRWLYKQTTGMNDELHELTIADWGDVVPAGSIEETHAEIERIVRERATAGQIVIFLGGGHDLSYASHAGVFEANKGRGAVTNLDTHLDVRPLKDGKVVTSGTPFRRLVERFGSRVAALLELGIQSQHNALADARWAREHAGRIVTLDELRAAPGVSDRLRREFSAVATPADFATVSLDLDVAPACCAPGTSAPPPDGIPPEALARFCELAGRTPKVKLLDLMELAPPHDENGKTARLAALCAWEFLVGVAAR